MALQNSAPLRDPSVDQDQDPLPEPWRSLLSALVVVTWLLGNSVIFFFFSSSLSCKLEGQVSPPVAAIIPPPPDIQAVIDKLAEYVARNGLRFEASVRAKNDPR